MDLLHLFPWRSALIRPQSTPLPTLRRAYAGLVRPLQGGMAASTLALAAVVAGVTPGLLMTQPAQAQLSSLLRIGQEGSSVETLQRQLIELGYLEASLATGYYGEKTEAAVLNFQADEGLFQDGVVGSQTFAALGLAGQGGDLPEDLSRREIGVLQTRLIALGYNPGSVDGVAGPQTASAIELFQRRNELRISRNADLNTLEEVTRVYERQRRLGSIRPNPELELALPAATPGTRETSVTIPQTGRPSAAEFSTVLGSEAEQRTRWVSGRDLQDRGDFREIARRNTTFRASSSNDYPYVIAIPGEGWQVLRDVQEYVPDAFLTENRRGAYVQAGAFATRADAEDEEQYLRDRGLDARVIFEQ